jgi:hypothetical protein
MAHETDPSGSSLEREMQQLQDHLGDLLGLWVRSYEDPEKQDAVVQEYHVTLKRLFALGWNDVLAIEDELPYELMPSEYLRRVQRDQAEKG